MADGEYEIETIDSKVVKWRNIELSKVSSNHMKNKNFIRRDIFISLI